MEFILRHKLITTVIVVQLIALPLLLFAAKQKQETRSNAAKSTTLSFSPDTSATPLAENNGVEFPVDVVVTPGNNLISLVKIEILYDQSKLNLSTTNPLVVNSQTFPQVVEGPLYTPGKIQIVLSIGPDQTKVVQTPTKAMTVMFKALSPTSQTQLTFGSASTIYSVAPQDASNENVLSTTVPANIKINAAPTSTPTAIPTPTPSPSPSPSPTPPPTAIPTPTPSPTHAPTPIPTSIPTLAKSVLSFKGLKLHGIGSGGDNPSPNSLGTKNPLHPQRVLSVEVLNTSGQPITSLTGIIDYNLASGDFSGEIDVPSSIPTGNYLIKIKTDKYLRKQLSGFISFVQGQINTLPSATLVAGDVNADNALSNADYDIIMGCYSDLLPPKNCDATRKLNADLSDDGKVDQDDYNLYMRELSVQQGE